MVLRDDIGRRLGKGTGILIFQRAGVPAELREVYTKMRNMEACFRIDPYS